MRTAYDLVLEAAERAPAHTALVDDESPRTWSYRELLAEVDAIAAGFAARGVAAGSLVATALPNSFDHCVAILALQRLAAVPCLLNFRLKPEEVAALVEQGGIAGALVLPDAALAERIRKSLPNGGVLLCAGLATGPAEPFSACRADPAVLPPVPHPDPEAPAFVFYTSGTTGLPKGVVLAHRTSEPRVVWLSTMLGLRAGPHLRALGCSPLAHVIGFHGVFLATLAFGGSFHAVSNFRPDAAIAQIERERLTYLFTLPTVLDAIVSEPGYTPRRLATLETVYWGGAPIEPALLAQLHREWNARLGHVYGTTETMVALTNANPVGEPDRLHKRFGARVRIADRGDPGRDAPAGQVGELCIGADGDAVFSGYLNRPEATAEKLRDGWYFTGDAAACDEDGSVRILSRLDDLIRSGGEFIQPDEVERVLATHPAVRASAVVGASDPRWGQVAVACVVANGDPPAPEQLDRLCRESNLADFKRPRFYAFIEALPASAGGKLQRTVLRERIAEAREGRGDWVVHEA
jgi:acyl-CoA synthetase (AMP-forming)/AMP-acid ligase II